MKWMIRPIACEHDPILFKIIRSNLEALHLDVPGTAYFDPELRHLSNYYQNEKAYFVLIIDNQVAGGIGMAPLTNIEDCAEVQKLYVDPSYQGLGFGKILIETLEDFAQRKGYKKLYLETHSNLKAAIHLYEKLGYTFIEKPPFVIHSTMNRFYIKNIGSK